MNKIEVIYARQSVDKRDSISIETQINGCEKKLKSENYRVFYDRGYSGKSTDRPQFQEPFQNKRVSRTIFVENGSKIVGYINKF